MFIAPEYFLYGIILSVLNGKEKSGSADSITGATITFKGISKALAAGAAYIQTELEGVR